MPTREPEDCERLSALRDDEDGLGRMEIETGFRSLLLYSTTAGIRGLRGFVDWAERNALGWRRLANTKLVSLEARLEGSMTSFASGAVVDV